MPNSEPDIIIALSTALKSIVELEYVCELLQNDIQVLRSENEIINVKLKEISEILYRKFPEEEI